MNMTAARTSGESRPNMARVEKVLSMRWLSVLVSGVVRKGLCVGGRGWSGAVQCEVAMNITAARTRGESRPSMARVEKALSTRWLRALVIEGVPEKGVVFGKDWVGAVSAR